MAKIDQLTISRELENGLKVNKTFKNQVFKEIVNPYFQEAKRELIREFEDSEVSKQIASGPGAEDDIGIVGGYGNLSSFIGFEAGEKPIDKVKEYLDRDISIGSYADIKTKNNIVTLTYPNVFIPTEADLNKDFPVPDKYQRNGWITAIEQGFSNLAHYVYDLSKKFRNSRSGPGIQADNVDSGGLRTFSKQNYLPSMLKKFREKLSVRL